MENGKPLVSGTDLLQWQVFHIFSIFTVIFHVPLLLVTQCQHHPKSHHHGPWPHWVHWDPCVPDALCGWVSERRWTSRLSPAAGHATACIAPRRFGWPGWPGWSHGFHARLQKSHQFIQNHPIMWEFIWVYYEKPFPIKLEHHDGMSTNNLIY